MASKLFTRLAPNYPCSKIAFWELTHHWRTKCLLFFHFSLTGLLFWDSIASFIGCGVNWVKICPPNQFQAQANHGQFWCVVWIIFTVYAVEGTLAWGLWGLLQVVLQWWFINTTLNVKQPRSLTTILVKTFGTLSHLLWSMHFCTNPPPPPGQCWVFRVKNVWKIFQNAWTSALFGGGGGNLSKVVFTIGIVGHSQIPYQKEEGKGRCCKPFWPNCRLRGQEL